MTHPAHPVHKPGSMTSSNSSFHWATQREDCLTAEGPCDIVSSMTSNVNNVQRDRPRVGLVLTGGSMRVTDMVAVAQAAESAGASGVYTVEAWRSGFVPLAAIAAATDRIGVGTYVINAYGRTPFLAGLAGRDLDDLSEGRLTLCVGSGNVFTNRVYQSVETDRPLRKMAEYVELLKLILDAKPGQSVEYVGEIHSMSHWMPQASSPREHVPVYLAALFPKMRKVAGRVADGIALGAIQGRSFLADTVLPTVRDAAEAAGRDPADIGVKVAQLTCIDEDRDRARHVAKLAIADLFSPKPHKQYEHTLREQGYGAMLDQVLERQAAGDREGAAHAIPDDVIDEVAVAGSLADCAARLREYADVVDEQFVMIAGGARHRASAIDTDERAGLDSAFADAVELIARIEEGARA